VTKTINSSTLITNMRNSNFVIPNHGQTHANVKLPRALLNIYAA